MERFIVSARKYRPDSFESLIGQENIATTLKNSITRKQLAHAYLFCGPRGVGKTSTARIFAKTINCLNPGESMDPCGECESCLSFAEGRSYSIHELDAASNNSVDDIRQLNELVRIPPQIGKYSVYIIDEVHMLSSSAFNAFLKTLEEPPAHAIFILATTEKHKILPTILSRCQTYDFNRISVEDIVKNLKDIAVKEGVEIELEALHIIAQKADGAMRDALTIFDQAIAFCGRTISYDKVISSLNVLDYDYYIRLTNFFLEGNHSEALLIFDEILSKGFNSLHFIGGLSVHFRDLLICKDKSTIQLLELAPSFIQKYREQSESCSLAFLYDALGITSACEAGYKSSGHQRLHIEIALIRLCRINSPAWVGESSLSKTAEPVKRAAEESAKKVDSEPAIIVSVQPEAQDIQESSPEPAAHAKEKSLAEQAPSPKEGSAVSISIKDLIKSAGSSAKAATAVRKGEVGTDLLDIEKLTDVWKKMAESESHMPRLSTAINQTKPIFREDNTIIFPVKNELQKNWIEQHCKARLLEFLKVNLNNRELKLDLEVTADDDPQEKKMYMPEEKAKFLMDSYPEVKEMQNDLKLELK
ncbi:MAG: DNA polymerase III subunit gamma/tau [Bacteroidetes bacterium HGW-Bacteroidetes-8]|jgi:DNA polymerase-3 subunit gamma/tau|nr:MAG: DNA polymerase III subunit gamma/tau [Bacteroidetes bacterium HGW-Bacteroidetes-8]